METFPIDERKLLASIPGFEALTPEEASRISVYGYEYSNPEILLTVDLAFVYRDGKGRAFNLKFEVAGSRQEGEFYSHVMYEETSPEKEFPDLRSAIDYCNHIDGQPIEQAMQWK